jgi:predicted patatin/cPLA2 family phospholipase
MPIQGTALVVEGGGQRGIFTAGVLDSWLAQDFNPFSLLIGTSAGAQNLSTYMTRQSGYAKRSIMQLSRHPNFFNMKRSFSTRHTMDLDWYFDRVCDPEYRLNLHCAQDQLKDRQLLFSATNTSGFSPAFLEPTADTWLTMLKASSALPYLYKKGVMIGDDHYIDGAVSLPIPIQEAYRRGAKKIIVLRTVPTNSRIRSPWAHKLKSWVCKNNTCPKVLDIITGHENAYNEAITFIDRPPADAQIIEIAPPTKLASRLLGSSDQALIADYKMGYEIGSAFLASQSAQHFKSH